MTAGPVREAWLRAGTGPDPAWLAARVAWWRDREADLVARGDLDIEPPGLALPRAAHEACEAWLPLERLRRDVHAALRAHFAADLDALGVDLRTLALARGRSWLDARARVPTLAAHLLPSSLLAALASARAAHDLVFALAAPPRLGSTLARHADARRALAGALLGGPAPPRGPLAAWDVGCGTGEGAWALAAALLEAGAARVEVVGTTPCPLERLMAERRARPHEPSRAAALAQVVAATAGRAAARFERGDVRAGAPAGGPFHAVTCHGLLGEGLDAPGDVARAVAVLAAALAPGGRLSVADRFRADRHARAAALVEAAAAAAGLAPEGAGLFLRP